MRARARVRTREWVLLWYVDSSSECVITVVIKYSQNYYNFAITGFYSIFRTAVCTFRTAVCIFPTAERTYRSGERKTNRGFTLIYITLSDKI